MTKFRVLVVSTAGGWTEVEAEDAESAEAAAQIRVDNEGSDCIYKDTHGENEVVGSAEKL
jgi:hypothetical protein